MRRHSPRWLTCLALMTLLASAPARSQSTFTYDPSLGTLPQFQGYTYVDLAPGAPAPIVSGGVLKQGPVAPSEMEYWLRQDVSFAFDQGFAIEAELRILSSGYAAPLPGDGSQRSGFYVEAIDINGRRLTLGIASGGVTVNTDLLLMPGNGIPLFAFSTVDAFHTYRLVTSSDAIYLFIDGVYRASTSLGPPIFVPGSRVVLFGDGTTEAGSQVDIGRVRYSSDPSLVDVPHAPNGSAGRLQISARRGLAPEGAELTLHAASPTVARVEVLDAGGRLVRDLGNAMARPEGVVLRWDGSDAAGRSVPTGVYFAIAADGAQRSACKVILIR